MGKPLRNILSELSTDVRALNIDDYISFRYLHDKFISKVEYFLRLESKSREIFGDISGWKSVCIDLIDANYSDCGISYNTCNTLKRSKDKITDLFDSAYGKTVMIFDINGINKFNGISSKDYKDYKTREYKKVNNIVYWFLDDYLYIPDTELESVRAFILQKGTTSANDTHKNKCNLILDTEVEYPDYLITLAKKEALNEIAGIYKRMVEDEKGDNNTNIKN